MYKKLLNKINEFDKITIYRHERPDGDAAFSSIGLYLYLKDNYKNKTIKLCGEDRYDLLSKNHKVSDSFIKNSLAIVLDTATKQRCDDQRFFMAKYIIKIDHHPAIDNYGDMNIVFPEYAATCELIADIILSNPFKNNIISKEVSKYLYCGLMTDTLNFKTTNTTAHTLLIGSKLIELGDLRVSELNEWLFNDDLKTFNALSKVRNYLIVKEHFGYIILDSKTIASLNMTGQELKNHISEIGNIKELNIWAFAVENEKGTYDCSYRSKRKYVVNKVCAQYGGGGHKNAAATKNLSLSQQKQIFNTLIELSTK